MSAKILQLSDLHVGKSKSESKNLKQIGKEPWIVKERQRQLKEKMERNKKEIGDIK